MMYIVEQIQKEVPDSIEIRSRKENLNVTLQRESRITHSNPAFLYSVSLTRKEHPTSHRVKNDPRLFSRKRPSISCKS